MAFRVRSLQLCMSRLHFLFLFQCLNVPMLTWFSHGTLSQNLATVSPFIGHYRRSITLLWRELFARPRTLICLLPVWVVLKSSLSTCIMQNSQTGEHVCLQPDILRILHNLAWRMTLLYCYVYVNFLPFLFHAQSFFRDHKQNWVL